MPSTPRRTRNSVLEPYRVTMAYTMGTLRTHKGGCPRTVLVWARDAEDAILMARDLVPHVHGITTVRPSAANVEAVL
jgi:hypothetical protein